MELWSMKYLDKALLFSNSCLHDAKAHAPESSPIM